ncbi:MAG TPA: corrinoid protein [Bacillota bacterium]|mgnify:CR=1 FL=1|jgi:corrinoid protein of di/trimethylamine methyltransferase|nr:cobalamin-binding protein [Bacillota bacterium]HOA35117.1 corrinoid protein [Bacillota bacterium]HOJ84200.1 corrinoid protein [Bacillota bacterium]HOL15868.1 corrinoid protein [Bacillota bacterium]HPZ11263.1 corrinoid protein [Bacillota bacterium]
MEKVLAQVKEAVIEGKREETLRRVAEAVEAGIEPSLVISKGLTEGLYVVGDKFEEGEYFLPDMMLAAEAMNGAIDYLAPLIKKSEQDGGVRMVIGTVKGDLHSIGKDIVIMMMKSAGFDVIDLGVDVSSATFVEAVREKEAAVLGISALMTTTIQEQKKVIDLLKEKGLRERVKVIVGGAPLSEEWAVKVGADGYAPDAISGVKKVKEMLGL